MSTLTPAPSSVVPTVPAATDTPIPLSRLVRVELRKLVDTRSGRWLLIAIGLITLAAITIVVLAAPKTEHTFTTFVAATATPQGFLLPVLGILLVTSEWSQRSAMVTFALEPRRARVVAAKFAAALLAGLLAIVLAVALAALAAAVFGNADPWRGLDAGSLGKFTLLQTLGLVQGLAFGLVLLRSAPAIVTYFVLPSVFTVLATWWSAMTRIQPWVDLGYAQTPLFEARVMTATEWVHLATTSALWVVLPLVAGLVRALRAEVK